MNARILIISKIEQKNIIKIKRKGKSDLIGTPVVKGLIKPLYIKYKHGTPYKIIFVT